MKRRNFMKKTKTMLLLLVMMLMMVSNLLVGCGSNEKPYDPDNFLPNGTAENPYQIFKERDTIEIFVPSSSMHSAFDDLASWKYIEEITNVDIVWREADLGAYATLRTAAWDDKGNLPDLFLFLNTLEEQMLLEDQGAIIPFTQDDLTIDGVGEVGHLINNYMPNYKALLDNNFGMPEENSVRDLMTLQDGNMYSLVSSRGRASNDYRFYLNQQWIRNLNEDEGLNLKENPETLGEYIAILEAFKQYDANRNGDPNDEIPLSYIDLSHISDFVLQAYGYVSGGAHLNKSGDGFVYVPYEPEYREYMKTMAYMYQNRLIDNNIFEMTNENFTAKGTDHRLGSFPGAAAVLTVGDDYDQEYTTIRPVIEGNIYQGEPMMKGSSPFVLQTSLVPQGTKKVREVARLLDMMYTDEFSLIFSYGVEGEHWDWDDPDAEDPWNDGVSTWHVIMPDDWQGTQEEFRGTLSNSVGSGLFFYTPTDMTAAPNRTSNEFNLLLREEDAKYDGYICSAIPANFVLSVDQENELMLIEQGLDAYITNQRFLFMTGEQDPSNDDDWNAFIQGLDDRKGKRLIEIYNAGEF